MLHKRQHHASTLAILSALFWGACGGMESAGDDLAGISLDSFVDLAMQEKITVPQAEEYFSHLDGTQRQAVLKLIEQRSERVPAAARRTEESPAGKPASAESDATLLTPAWTEDIENVWTYGIPPGSVFGTFVYEDWNCDNDPTDKEYVFYYPFPAFAPSAIRWTTTSARVYATFMAAYSGNLLGFGQSSGEVRLCIGDRGVNLAGGTAQVLASIFVHY